MKPLQNQHLDNQLQPGMFLVKKKEYLLYYFVLYIFEKVNF
jgi:hypothetical protein